MVGYIIKLKLKHTHMKGLITIATMMLLFISCKKDRLTANGNMKTETRNPGTFTGVRSSGSNVVHVNYGNEYSVKLKGSSNLIPYFRTNVVNGKLTLSYENVDVRHDDVEVFVTLPMLKSTALYGSGKMTIGNNFPNTGSFRVDLSGSGQILVSSAMFAEEVDVAVSGSGDVDLERLASRFVDARISGSGDVRIKRRVVVKGNNKWQW